MPLNIGGIAAIWLQSSGGTGNNYMLFDNYLVLNEPSQVPRIITPPQSQTNRVGSNVTFLVVVDAPLPVTYQWQFNGTNLPGQTAATLVLNNISFSQAGSYSVVITDAAGTVTAGPATLTITHLPNLTPYKPTGWSDKIVATTNSSSVLGSALDPMILYSHQEVYVDWAVVNNSPDGNINATFYSQLYLDGVLNHTWYTPGGLPASFFAYVLNYDLGKLSVGTHTLRLDHDTTGVVPESNENDNSYTKTIIVSSTNNTPPVLGTPARSANGVFQFNLTGIPLRSYELQASTNLTNWSVLATLVDSNGNGVFLYPDSSATNLSRRFYRARLLSP